MSNDSQFRQITDLFLKGNTIVLFMRNKETCICKNKFISLSEFEKLLTNADKARVI